MKLLKAMNLLIKVQNRIYKTKSCCVKCRKYAENINLRVLGTSNGKAMILSKYAICRSKKLRFIKNQEAKGRLSNLVLKTL